MATPPKQGGRIFGEYMGDTYFFKISFDDSVLRKNGRITLEENLYKIFLNF